MQRERPISAVIEQSVCAACGYPVSYTDEGGCVGTPPNAYHMRATCLLEAYRREGARVDHLREAVEEAIQALEALPRRPSAERLLDVRVGLQTALRLRGGACDSSTTACLMPERPISADERSYDPERDRLQQLRRERDALQAEVEHLRHAMQDADKMAADPTTARAILRAALNAR